MEEVNITHRKHNTGSLTNESVLTNDDGKTIFDTTMMNLTDSRVDNINDNDTINDLLEQIQSLKMQLRSSHQEIDDLNSENFRLKSDLQKALKNVETDDKTSLTPGKKRSAPSPSNENKLKNRKLSSNMSNNYDSNSSIIHKETEVVTINKKTQHCNNKKCLNTLSPPLKRNLCVISSEFSNRIFTMSEGTCLRNYNMCHYRTPRCGIEYNLRNIENKVRNFTSSDYCIILIGEEDFKKTNNYIELVTLIREKLSQLSHTNFIICLPTFKYMDNSNVMFNSRIDTFNNLIYMDVQTYNYAFILDSNLNLPYTYDTYNYWHGNLNNKGFNIVISDLQDLILDLDTLNTIQPVVDCPQNKQFEKAQDTSQFFL